MVNDSRPALVNDSRPALVNDSRRALVNDSRRALVNDNRRPLDTGGAASRAPPARGACSRCLSRRHVPAACPFRSQNCYAYGAVGHTRAACRSRAESQRVRLLEEEEQPEPSVTPGTSQSGAAPHNDETDVQLPSRPSPLPRFAALGGDSYLPPFRGRADSGPATEALPDRDGEVGEPLLRLSAVLPAAVLPAVVLPAVVLSAAVLSAAVLSAAVLSAAVLSAVVLPAAVLSAAVLSAAVLPAAVLPAAVLPAAVLPAAVLPAAVLSAAVLSAAVLSAVVLPAAVLSAAVLSAAALCGEGAPRAVACGTLIFVCQ
ncbi:hypothetical protein FJT64_014038 [Amphibalanus amphitrite]|uniref:Uncharacterized protein n=1 Tax=Amphibalanus amphitrite TaxID=1232801 RepID=A0A6A4V8Q8_AMPAM|nr:hypothetical protein FJT64_014038 [Amphibalanus amphitrite]